MKELQGIIRFVTLLNKMWPPATSIDCKTPIEVWSGKLADYSKLCVSGFLEYYHVSEGKLDSRGDKGIFMGYGDGVEDVPKQVEHVVLGDTNHDVTLPDEHTNSPHLVDFCNTEIDDEDATLILLVSLPPSFENFVNSFVVSKDTVTLEDVRSSLHSRELRHQASRTLESQPVGFSATTQDRDDPGSERDVVLSVVDYKGTPLVWIMDSGCSFHMIPSRDWSPATAIDCKTPIEVWSGKLADYSKLRVSRFLAYYHVSEGKLDSRGEKGIFMGYGDGVKGYRIWSPSERRVIFSRDVEHVVLGDTNHDVTSPDEHTNSPHLVNEQERKVVGCKRVFKMKTSLPGSNVMRFKASLVAKRYRQKEGIDYNEIFSPVERHTSIRMLLSLVAHHDLELEKLNVKTAFLHGDLEEEIYMSQPEGFVVQSKEDYVCKLQKSLYGLKQSSRQWYKRFDSFMDIAHAMSVVSRYMAHLEKEHWNAMKRIFCYMKRTFDVDLIYGGEREYLVVGYSYSNYAVNLDAKRSLTFYVFTIGNSVVTKEGIWLKGLIEDLGFPQDQATVFCESMNAICLAKDQVYHDRTKYIDVHYHFICTERRIKVKKIDTEDHHADVFTKPVPLSKFHHCLDFLNIDNLKYGVT
nr:retrovirus-related Pol polyprotein from transposon TNT 1-94 [Tanacetum cinerariifolium]